MLKVEGAFENASQHCFQIRQLHRSNWELPKATQLIKGRTVIGAQYGSVFPCLTVSNYWPKTAGQVDKTDNRIFLKNLSDKNVPQMSDSYRETKGS